MSAQAKPVASVIIPVRNHAAMLRECVACLRRSEYRDFEIIIVDDASTDWHAEAPPVTDVTWTSRRERGGPAAARNLGAQIARGEILVFLDSDVAVHPETLGRLLKPFHNEATTAVFGSYDAQPRALNVISQFRNLLHHHVHQTADESATTFWAGCGAIRKSAFFSLGGFDPAFRTPSIEDIELGVRLCATGRRILIVKQAQATHLKRWSLTSMVTCDLWRRAVPWALLILRDHHLPDDLNLKKSQRASVTLSVVWLVALLIAARHQPWLLALPPLAVAATVTLGEGGRLGQFWACLVQAAILAAYGHWGTAAAPIATVACTCAALGIVAANFGFYRFLAGVRGPSFAVTVFPLHVIFFLTCAMAVMFAAVIHVAARLKCAWPWIREVTDARATVERRGPEPFLPID